MIIIYIQNPSSALPPVCFDSEGYCSFDLQSDFDIKESLTTDAISDLSEIQDTIGFASTILSTPKNDAIYELYKNSIIDIKIISGSKIMIFDRMILEKNGISTYDLKLETQNPLRKFKDVKIHDLDFGNIDIPNPQAFYDLIKDGLDDSTFYLPIAHLGQFTDTDPTEKKIHLRDTRVWVRELDILQKAAQKLGFSFQSDYYKVEAHKRIFNHLYRNLKGSDLIEEFGARGVNSELSLIYGVSEQSQTIADFLIPKFRFTGEYSEIYDNINKTAKGIDSVGVSLISSNTAISITGLSGSYKINGRFFIRHGFNSTAAIPQFGGQLVVRTRINGAYGLIIDACQSDPVTLDEYQAQGNNFIETNSQSDILELKPTDVLEIDFLGLWNGYEVSVAVPNGTGIAFEIGKASFIELQPVEIYITEGINKPVNTFINRNTKAIDIYKGVAHSINGLFLIDYFNKVIRLMPFYDTVIDNIAIEGYYKNNHVDIRNIQVVETLETDYPSNESSRFAVVSYKDNVNSDTVETFRQRKYDFGENYKNDTRTIENPTYSQFGQILTDILSISGQPQFPIADLRSANDSSSVNDNELILRGICQNGRPANIAEGTFFWFYAVTANSSVAQKDYFPTVYMLPETNYNGRSLSENIVFNNDLNNQRDLSSLFYDRRLNEEIKAIRIVASFRINQKLFNQLSLRDYYIILTKRKKSILVRCEEVSEYSYNEQGLTQLKLTHNDY